MDHANKTKGPVWHLVPFYQTLRCLRKTPTSESLVNCYRYAVLILFSVSVIPEDLRVHSKVLGTRFFVSLSFWMSVGIN